jgi:hypothetical protein
MKNDKGDLWCSNCAKVSFPFCRSILDNSETPQKIKILLYTTMRNTKGRNVDKTRALAHMDNFSSPILVSLLHSDKPHVAGKKKRKHTVSSLSFLINGRLTDYVSLKRHIQTIQ